MYRTDDGRSLRWLETFSSILRRSFCFDFISFISNLFLHFKTSAEFLSRLLETLKRRKVGKRLALRYFCRNDMSSCILFRLCVVRSIRLTTLSITLPNQKYFSVRNIVFLNIFFLKRFISLFQSTTVSYSWESPWLQVLHIQMQSDTFHYNCTII